MRMHLRLQSHIPYEFASVLRFRTGKVGAALGLARDAPCGNEAVGCLLAAGLAEV